MPRSDGRAFFPVIPEPVDWGTTHLNPWKAKASEGERAPTYIERSRPGYAAAIPWINASANAGTAT